MNVDGLRPALLVVAKAAIPGLVKTRLSGRFDPDQAAEIHRCCLESVINRARSWPFWAKWLFYSPAGQAGWFREMARGDYDLVAQPDGDLGERLRVGFQACFDRGAGAVVAIGADSPHMPAETVGAACRRLADHDLVLVPSDDGGYCLIGLSGRHFSVLDRIDWGGRNVLSQTVQRAGEIGLRVWQGPTLFDVDRPHDVDRLLAVLASSRDGELRGLGVRLAGIVSRTGKGGAADG